jgi:nucleotide-binding universal stress UspA family protein
MFAHILSPVDGSDCSLHALDVAARFAKEQGALLTICTIADPGKAAGMAFGEPTATAAMLDALEAEARGIVNDAGERVSASPAQRIVFDGPPAHSIAEYARTSGCDLIVMGSHGRTGLRRLFIGSVAEGVLREAPVPVLIVRDAKTHREAQASIPVAKTAKAASL